MNRSNMGQQILKSPGRKKPVRMAGGGVPKDSPFGIAMHGLSNEGSLRGLGQAVGVSGKFSRMLKEQEDERLAREGGAQSMRKGGKVQKPLYERPRPEGLKSKTMTPAQKAEAARIAKKSGDKKVGLYARISAMRKKK